MNTSDPHYPILYHAHHSRHTEDLPFWLELAGQQGGPILELGCGTGRVLVALAQAGYPVFGLDHDAHMLAVLLDHLPPGTPALVFQADLGYFRLSLGFSLILVPCNTWSTLTQATRRAALAKIADHLLPGGLFAASIPNPALLRRQPRRMEAEVEDDFPHPGTGNPVQVSTGWERTGQVFRLEWLYDHLLPDGRVERLSVQVDHDLAPLEAHHAELVAAGLLPDGEYGDYDRSPYRPDSPYLILTARQEQDF
ncbi:MAG TPA: class I SAM-dependent methyltransferase [Anaerolineales bacterium]